jgi:hypothetical protein
VHLDAQYTFAHELLGAGQMLTDLIDDLVETLSERDPWPGEQCGAVIVEMVAGSIARAMKRVPDAELELATGLVYDAAEAVLADLRFARDMRKRRDSMRKSA